MEYRELGRTGWRVSAISTGTWAMGSLWGNVSDSDSLAALNKALDLGVNFFDTADVYGSEHLLGKLRKQRREPFYVATKLGMQVNPDLPGYTCKNISAFVDKDVLRNTKGGFSDLAMAVACGLHNWRVQKRPRALRC